MTMRCAKISAQPPLLRALCALSVLFLLPACAGQQPRMASGAPLTGAVGTEQVLALSDGQSGLIRDLQSRSSVLAAGGPFSAVAEQVLAASQGAAAAQLRVAQLRAQAQSQNWLPQVGPSVSLTSLSGLVASLMLTQPLLDNGRRKAAREFAAADVEVAAVSLSQGMNQRVYDGLVQYINTQRAQAAADVSRRAAEQLDSFDALMQARVQGGLSDMSEQQVIAQRMAEIQSTIASDQAAAANAQAQLAALMGGADVSKIKGLDKLGDVPAGPLPLSVLRQQGEGARTLAQSKLTRAEMMPGLTASANVTPDGTDPGLRLTGLGMLNPGASASLQALAETETIVQRQNAESAAAAQLRLLQLTGEIDMLTVRATQGEALLTQTKANLDLFTQQYQLGRRSLLELVGQYDAFAQLERDQTMLHFEIALLRVEIARDLGLLVDGERL